MTSKGMGRICMSNRNLNAEKYINEIREPTLKPFACDLFQYNETFYFNRI